MEARRARQCPPEPAQYPWLVFRHGKNYKNQTFCDVGELGKTTSSVTKSIPELKDRQVLACCHGWLVLSKETEYLLWNPVTLEVIQLPPLTLKHKQRVTHCILSSPPLNDDSMVILLDECSSLAVFCSPGDENWTYQWLTDSLSCPASCNGKLYALMGGYRTLVEIKETEKKQLAITSLETEMPPINLLSFSVHMVESCGELFLMFFKRGGMKFEDVICVEILRFDFSSKVWTKVRIAKDRVFFVSDALAFSCGATEPTDDRDQMRGNSVYFTMDNDKSLYRYDIEDECVSVSLPCAYLPTPWHSPIWIMPELRHRPSNQVDESEKEKLGLRSIEIKETNRITESEENAGGKLMSLPLDVLDVIARGLTPFDYMSFRAVNRTCRSIAPPVQSRSSTMGFENLSLFPWLMRRQTDYGVCSFIDPMNGNTVERYQLRIPDGCNIPYSKMCCSRDGWCIMIDMKETSTFFWNPFAKKVIPMPNLYSPRTFLGFGFSSSPTASDCVVVAIDWYSKHDNCIDFLRLGVDQECYTITCPDFYPSYNNNIVFCKGRFYVMNCVGSLGVIGLDPNHEYFSFEVLQKPQRPCISFHQNFILECEGELLSVFVGFMGKWVRVFKLIDLSETEMAWVEVRNLGNQMLFVSDLSSFSAVAKTPSMANKIYFPRFYEQGIVFYSLDSCKFQTFKSEECLDNFYNTTEPLLFSWIEPKWF